MCYLWFRCVTLRVNYGSCVLESSDSGKRHKARWSSTQSNKIKWKQEKGARETEKLRVHEAISACPAQCSLLRIENSSLRRFFLMSHCDLGHGSQAHTSQLPPLEGLDQGLRPERMCTAWKPEGTTVLHHHHHPNTAVKEASPWEYLRVNIGIGVHSYLSWKGQADSTPW